MADTSAFQSATQPTQKFPWKLVIWITVVALIVIGAVTVFVMTDAGRFFQGDL